MSSSPMHRHVAPSLTLLTLAGAAFTAAAQKVGGPQPPGASAETVTLTPASPLKQVEFTPRQIDQGIQDRGALSGSLWNVPTRVDLKHESAWLRIFETRSRDGNRQYVRYDGALKATFPVSDYVVSEKQGVYPITPGGTEFHIGSGWDGDLTGEQTPGAENRPVTHSPLYINGRISGLASEPVERRTPHFERPVDMPTMADEEYRQRRIGELMRLAALDAVQPRASAR